MAGNNSKYSPEYREEINQLIISSGRSATSIAEEMGIDKNAVCSPVREYRRKNQMPRKEKGSAKAQDRRMRS